MFLSVLVLLFNLLLEVGDISGIIFFLNWFSNDDNRSLSLSHMLVSIVLRSSKLVLALSLSLPLDILVKLVTTIAAESARV